MSGTPRLAMMTALAGALAVGCPLQAGAAGTVPGAEAASWDQVASIRGAAERLGRLHRAKGAKAAFELIDNCYRTHSLSATYGEGFEICITQDYLETRTLVHVYSGMPPETLQQAGVPSPAELANSMGERISTAFRHYGKSQAYADELRKLVDEHGYPVFAAIVFPEAMKAIEDKKKAKQKK